MLHRARLVESASSETPDLVIAPVSWGVPRYNGLYREALCLKVVPFSDINEGVGNLSFRSVKRANGCILWL